MIERIERIERIKRIRRIRRIDRIDRIEGIERVLRRVKQLFFASAACAALVVPSAVLAAGGSAASSSPLSGNGHNVSFDGRVYIVKKSGGWFAMVLRPQNIRYVVGGTLDLEQGAFTEPVEVQPEEDGENALALCEEDPDHTPYACDEDGMAVDDGPFDCYEWWVISSNASGGEYKGLRRRPLKLWVSDARTPDADYYKHEWLGSNEFMTRDGGDDLQGIEPTVSRDGRLLAFQGHPDNDGRIDILMYATSTGDPCDGDGWDGPYVISHMHADPNIVGKYALGERQLRAADGTPYADGQLVRGAYPWLFHEGDALIFTATRMPCESSGDPPGCGARRNTLSVIGYPTNWGLAPIDSGLNPTTTAEVRLFFSSPGPTAFEQLPLTGGIDVWPFFGSNTSNSGDVVFDDALDGNYAGVWHMNESVNDAGELDRERTPDTSGHFNTGQVIGATFPDENNGLFGKALVFDGADDRVEVPHSDTLEPIGALSIEAWVNPSESVDCDDNDNYRVLLAKGDALTGSYSITLEEGELLRARVKVDGQQRSVLSDGALAIGEWTRVGVGYDGATGTLQLWLDGELAGETRGTPGELDGNTLDVTIGGPGARDACPDGDGAFAGMFDEVSISRVLRDLSMAARPGNGARYVEHGVPAQAEAGKPFTVTFTFRNVGTTAWAPGLAHSLGAQGSETDTVWGTERIALPGRIEPGQLAVITAEFVAPTELGVYSMQWQMVQEDTEWFGPMTDLVEVEVVPFIPDPGGTGDGSGDDAADDGDSGGTGGAGNSGSVGSVGGAAPGDSAGGCSCRSNPGSGGAWWGLSLLPIFVARRRRGARWR